MNSLLMMSFIGAVTLPSMLHYAMGLNSVPKVYLEARTLALSRVVSRPGLSSLA